jgi:alkyl sulfatase BDS1-like metallo-beta-lactamase superfamily hydrolase
MKLRILTVVCLLSSVTFADKPNTTPEQQEAAKIEQLKQKVEHDSEREICYNSAELVRNLVEQFNNQMNAGELKPAQQTLNDIGTYAEKARDAAKKSHHKLKQAELTLHKSARRLSDIAQALSVEDREAIDKVVKKIEAADDDILNQVFKN